MLKSICFSIKQNLACNFPRICYGFIHKGTSKCFKICSKRKFYSYGPVLTGRRFNFYAIIISLQYNAPRQRIQTSAMVHLDPILVGTVMCHWNTVQSCAIFARQWETGLIFQYPGVQPATWQVDKNTRLYVYIIGKRFLGHLKDYKPFIYKSYLTKKTVCPISWFRFSVFLPTL
jgi:hypothetical protein